MDHPEAMMDYKNIWLMSAQTDIDHHISGRSGEWIKCGIDVERLDEEFLGAFFQTTAYSAPSITSSIFINWTEWPTLIYARSILTTSEARRIVVDGESHSPACETENESEEEKHSVFNLEIDK